MFLIPNAVFIEYVAHLNKRKVPVARSKEYIRWLRYYLEFCDKFPVPDAKSGQVRLFTAKLRDMTQEQRNRAAHAISLYFEMQKQNNPSPERRDVGLNCSSMLNCSNLCKAEQFPRGGGVVPFYETNKKDSVPAGSKSAQLHSGHQNQLISQDSPQPSNILTRRSHYSEAGYEQKSDSPEWDAVLVALGHLLLRLKYGMIPERHSRAMHSGLGGSSGS